MSDRRQLRIKRALFLGVALVPYGFLVAQTTKPRVSFSKDVLPIFKAHCVSCHTGIGGSGGLDLSDAKGVQKAVKLFIAGNPSDSYLIHRIKGLDGMSRMPVGFAPLSDEDTAKIEAWISDGAKFDEASGVKHWAYVTPVRPKVPAIQSDWIRNPIDAFVFERLRKEGLHPSMPASKEILLRRVTLDITGLPPTPAELDAFLADKTPNAYDKVVDRLLASPHYGEKMAMGWLDLARYADSNGYEKDLRRTAWKYRDWVIDAFNANMPYDKFTIDQIAGDLLPNSTLSDKVATGFNRNTMFNQEGGVDQAEAHFGVVLDRVDTTATVWLGSTLGCARCHDHKYDPFTQRDYYRMAAFYDNTEVYPRGPKDVGEEKWFEAEIPVPDAAQLKKEQALNASIAAQEKGIQAQNEAIKPNFDQWKTAVLTAPVWAPVKPTALVSTEKGVELKAEADNSVLVTGKNPDQNTYQITFQTTEPTTGLQLETLPDSRLGTRGAGRIENGNFVLTSVKVSVDGVPNDVAVARADFVQAQYNIDRLFLDDGKSGWAVDPQEAKPHNLACTLEKPIPAGAKVTVSLAFASEWKMHTLGRFRISTTSHIDPVAAFLPDPVRKRLTEGSQDNVAESYFHEITPLLAGLRKQLAIDKQALAKLKDSTPTAMVMKEKPTAGPLKEFIRHRGEFMTKTDEVTAGTPAVLPLLNNDRANRLDLAKWIVRKDNPLTARVEINRLWESVFGRGLVETSEDFGTRGSPPTHPELMDWLATEFMARNWDVKAMMRMIVMSSTYRQSSAATADLIEKDPQNLLYARGARFRLPAESIRDEALAASGLLSKKVGGPSVFPSQPDGTWDSPYSGESWMPSKGEDQFRRGLYTFWKRTATYPAFMAFDATSRESCTVRRIRTNTPLQALEMLNDQAVLEASKALGTRMRKAGTTNPERLKAGFRLCTSRLPNPTELTRLQALFTKLKSRYTAKPKEAAKVGGNAEDAAWTLVGSVLLNLDETITKG